jgi:hypothetical protein
MEHVWKGEVGYCMRLSNNSTRTSWEYHIDVMLVDWLLFLDTVI